MTQKIQMVESLLGTRWDDQPWPPAGGALDVPDWEAEHLIRGRFARPWPGDSEPPAQGTSEPAPQPEPPAPEPAPAEPPKPQDPKSAWVEYAVAHGDDRAAAEQSTKQELIAIYGGRP